MKVIFVLIALFLIWGIYGGYKTRDMGYTCDVGSQGEFCLSWYTNAIGMFGIIMEDFSKELGYGEEDKKIEKDTRTPEEKLIEGINNCQPNGIVLSISSDGGVSCESKNTEHGKQLIEEGYTVLTSEIIETIKDCIKEGNNVIIYPTSIICEV